MEPTDTQLEQGMELPNAALSDHAELSDEELLERLETDPTFSLPPQAEPVEEPTEEDQTEEVAEPLSVEELEEQAPANVDQEPEQELEEETSEATEQTPLEAPADAQTPKAQEAAAAPDVDHKAFYEAVTRTFKANGRDLQVTDPNDIIALMQQGANYDKKMAAIKPALQVHRTLEKAGLLDPATISFMIDLYQGKPEAISKLAKDREIDLYSLDAKAEDYVPRNVMASEQEVELSSVITELEANPSFKTTFEALNTWDAKSQQEIVENPQMLRWFQSHQDAGIFGTITAHIERERMFGRLVGMSNLEAYKLVGDRLYGGPVQGQEQAQPLAQRPAVPQPVHQQATPTPIPDPRVTAQKQATVQKRTAAAAPRKVAVAKPAEHFNPLAVSDDEIEEIIARSQRLG